MTYEKDTLFILKSSSINKESLNQILNSPNEFKVLKRFESEAKLKELNYYILKKL